MKRPAAVPRARPALDHPVSETRRVSAAGLRPGAGRNFDRPAAVQVLGRRAGKATAYQGRFADQSCSIGPGHPDHCRAPGELPPRPTGLRPLSPHGGDIRTSRPSAELAGRCCWKNGGLERGLPRLSCASGLAGSTCVARAFGGLSRSQGRAQHTPRDFLVEQLFRDDRKVHSQLFRNAIAAACSRHVRRCHGDSRTSNVRRRVCRPRR